MSLKERLLQDAEIVATQSEYGRSWYLMLRKQQENGDVCWAWWPPAVTAGVPRRPVEFENEQAAIAFRDNYLATHQSKGVEQC